MRINRLDLTRYGKFTDGVIDFGSPPVGSPDLHIIYGPNEAGKSTTSDSILDLIFGIGTTSRYGFLHPYASMRIGANIRVAGQDREFVRIKRPQNSLLDAEERILSDAVIRADLGGIDRTAFTTMFCLDDETLEKGGQSILASKGDLGELLFSASAGLSDLSRQLLAIRGETDAFYRYRARSGGLGELKATLQDLKQQREAIDLQASDFQRLIAERDRLSRLYDSAIAERAQTQKRIDEIRRILQTIPPMGRLSGLRLKLADLEVVPEPPESWRQELPQLKSKEIEYRVKLDDLSRSSALLEEETAALEADPVALKLAAGMDEFSELKARYLTAQKDIPKLSTRAAELSIESILSLLGRPGEASPSRLVLDAATVGALRALIGSKSGVDARTAGAADELAKAEHALAEEGVGFREVDALQSAKMTKAFELLAATLKAQPRSEEELVFRSLSRRRDAASGALSEAMTRLLPWHGTVAELGVMACPSAATLESWKKVFQSNEEVLRSARAELERLEPEARRLDAEIEALRSQAGEIDEATATASRTSRDRAWTEHRQAMDAASADLFEAAMRADDRVLSQRLLHYAELGKLNQLLLRRATVGSDVRTALESYRRAEAELDKIRLEIAQRISPDLQLAPDPQELEEWLRNRDAALKTRDDLTAVEQDMADVRDRVAQAKRSLTEALNGVAVRSHPDADLAALASVADKALAAFNHARARAMQMERLRKDVLERREAFDVAERAAAEWALHWKTTCEGCWLGELDQLPGVGPVTEILSTLGKLASAIEAKDGLIDRIQKMEKDKAQFEARVLELCSRLAIPADGSPSELAQTVVEKVRDAVLDQQRLEKLERDLDTIRKERHDLKLEQELLEARARKMTEFFGVETLDEVEARTDLAGRRRDLSLSIFELEQELVESSGASDIAGVEELVGAADKTELEEELARLTPVLEDQDLRCSEVFRDRSRAQDALDAIGGDSKVAEIEEQRRTTLLEIEDGARRYMELRAGVAAAEHGLRLYRDRHRSGMMARASSAFRTISRGAYQGVAAQPGKDGDILIAVTASGGSKAADELSKGARFQLYLALRVAGYHEFVENRVSVPFIADDIMETFDDFRAEEAFRLFAEMARHGQVIYLTHHRHLTDIGRHVCPGVRLHDLDDVGATRLEVVAAE
ncbi:AAA family ATPase [Ensifer sp. P24N7]|uniref:AAA family ATPase n=1 Tax=Sinorhizobium sp. P24N7 TaxID=3348358 RepID=UPI0035F4E21F